MEGSDDLWYLRNRSRDSILSMARTIREIQLISGLKDSEVFVIFTMFGIRLKGTKWVH